MNNNKRATKRALMTSVTALVMCVVMLAGTTFAWFTDTASTAVNKIQAGNLKMEVMYRTSNTEGTDSAAWKHLDRAADLFGTDGTLFEPGHTRVVELKIKNAGNLAFKYKIGMNVVSEQAGTNKDGDSYKLSDYLKVKTTGIQAYPAENGIGTMMEQLIFQREDYGMWTEHDFANFELEEAGNGNFHNLTPGGEAILGIKVYMPESVGNEANARTPGEAASIKFGLNVLATQYTVESDSFGSNYDKDATYLAPGTQISTAEDLTTAISEGVGEVSITDDITLEEPVQITGDTVIHGNGKTIALDNESSISSSPLFDGNGHDLTIDDLVLDGTNGSIDNYFGVVNGGTDSTLTLSNVTIRNFNTQRILRAVGVKNVILTNVEIINNQTQIGTSRDAAFGLLFTNVENVTLKNVSITGNTVEDSLIAMYGNSAMNTLVAENITIEGNTVGQHIIATSGTNHLDSIVLTSGSIKDNISTGNRQGVFMVGNLTIGAGMNVECGIVVNNANGGGVCTLTNNGTINGDISSADWAANSRGKPIYAGTGTHMGTKTNFTVQ